MPVKLHMLSRFPHRTYLFEDGGRWIEAERDSDFLYPCFPGNIQSSV